MHSIIDKKRWTKANTGFTERQRYKFSALLDDIELCKNLDREKNNLLHLAVICNEIEFVKYLLNEEELKNQKNKLGYTPLELAKLLGRYEIVRFFEPCKQRIFKVEKNNKYYEFSIEQFEKYFGIHFLPTIQFNNIAILEWVVKRCNKALKKKDIPKEQKWNGSYYAKEIDEGFMPDVTIKWIDSSMGFGLFANKKIKKKAFIGEYSGLLRKYSHRQDNKNAYCFEYLIADQFDTPFIIDAKDQGNHARFINHHDDGNLTPISVYHQNIMRVILQANQDIPAGEQLCYCYGPEYWAKREQPVEL